MSEGNSLISVIVPVYKVENCLRKCVDSILAQTYTNLEIILVDDGSPDKSGQICEEYKKKDKRIKVIHKENGGLSSARNVGLDLARGEYYAFVDSDDYIEKETYELLYNAIKEYETDIACQGIIRENEQTGDKQIIRTPEEEKVYNCTEALYQILLSNEIGISVWSKLYKKEVFDNVRFPEGKTNEDAAILLQTLKGRTLVHIAKPTYHYMFRDGSITSHYSINNCECFFENSLDIMKEIQNLYPEIYGEAEVYFTEGMLALFVRYYSQSAVKDANMKKYLNEYKKHWTKIFTKSKCQTVTKLKCLLLRMHMLKILYKFKRRG